MRPGRPARAISNCSGRFVVRTNRISASSLSPSISLSNLFSIDSSHGPPISSRARAIRSTSSMTTSVGWEQPSKIHILRKQPHLFGSNDQGGMSGQIAGQITDRMGLPSARRPIKQNAFSCGLAKRAKAFANLDEVQDIAVEELYCRFGQDHLMASDRRQPMDNDALRPASVVAMILKRQDLAAIGSRCVDRGF